MNLTLEHNFQDGYLILTLIEEDDQGGIIHSETRIDIRELLANALTPRPENTRVLYDVLTNKE